MSLTRRVSLKTYLKETERYWITATSYQVTSTGRMIVTAHLGDEDYEVVLDRDTASNLIACYDIEPDDIIILYNTDNRYYTFVLHINNLDTIRLLNDQTDVASLGEVEIVGVRSVYGFESSRCFLYLWHHSRLAVAVLDQPFVLQQLAEIVDEIPCLARFEVVDERLMITELGRRTL